MTKAARYFVSGLILLAAGWIGGLRAEAGADLVPVFARAARGEPLRYVAMGGSITEAGGPGWVGEWLREEFPGSLVSVVNSGMSGTGGSLGVFRVERDVIAHQPDLVLIEFCVNDGGLPDEQAVRYMETLVVRLKSLPNPPAIVVVEAAARVGVNLARHRRVARHYDLLEVDMQAAVDERLARTGESWGVLFSDDVHPNREGHAFYAHTLREALRPFVGRGREALAKGAHVAPMRAAPRAQLSEKPLLLDARMAPLHTRIAPGWRAGAAPARGWGRHFQGVLVADEPGAALRIPVRGTAVGLFYALNKGHGTFFVNVDGGVPRHVAANTRDGFSSINLAVDLPAREHVLTVALPLRNEGEPGRNGQVTLGHLLVAGESLATAEPSPQGAFTAGKMSALAFVPVPASAWSWRGPFASAVEGESRAADARGDIHVKFSPEPGDADFAASGVAWRPVEKEGDAVDFRALIGGDAPAVVYARTALDGGAGGEVLLSLDVDYYCQLWISGERVLVFDGPHPRPHFFEARLRPGMNDVFVKVGAGSAGHGLALRVARP